ncbi:hypothetical protein [Metabacillus endolithicus]|uniref:Uncharacterized protein n=1 Tax=Metabacillus endolithicus TaxID=1535204 RepID=A0ABW5C5Z1_9BACI
MSEKLNYHGFLHNLAPKMDKVLDIFRTESTKDDIKSNWFGDLVLLIIKDLKKFYKPVTTVGKMKIANLTGLPIIGGAVASVITWFAELHWALIAGITLLVFVAIFLCLIPFYKDKMLNIYHPYFNLQAYKKYRPIEYELLNHTVYDKHFSYSGLAAYVTGVLTKQDEDSKIVQAITTQYNKQEENLKNEILELRNREQSAMDEYRDTIKELDLEIEVYESTVSYLVHLIDHIQKILLRISSDDFDYPDLAIISDFTLYEYQEGMKLKKIADVGTTAEFPKYIDLEREMHHPKIQSIIDVFNSTTSDMYHNQPEDGYEVVSYKMKMGKERNNTIWIISLQINKSVNERGLLLSVSNDIVDKRVIYKILLGLSRILYDKIEREEKKGAGSNVTSKI